MAKKKVDAYRLPPMDGPHALAGPNVESFAVGSWCPTPDGSGPPTCVAITITIKDMGDVVLRIKSPERVDQIIQMLLRHKRDVWPHAR
jgi:hypothetical protein